MKKINYSPVRRSIGQYVRVAGSIHHIAVNVEIRASRIQEYCAQNNITVTPVLMKAIAAVVKKYPMANGILARDIVRKKIFLPEDVDISLAMEKDYKDERFVTTPVIRGVQAKSIRELSGEIDTLSATPFNKRPDIKPVLLFNLLPDFLKYITLKCICQSPHLFKQFFGTIGFSNLGKFGIVDFFPVWLNSTVFAVGSMEDRPVVDNGRVVVAPVLHMSFCFNHCVLDGAMAGRVLLELKRIVEEGSFS